MTTATAACILGSLALIAAAAIVGIIVGFYAGFYLGYDAGQEYEATAEWRQHHER